MASSAPPSASASASASAKRKLQPTVIPVPNENDILKITPLGAGSEVGRSCVLLEFKGKTVMLDCGLHPAYTGLASLPFFDMVDPASIDVLLITHFHVDHAAALPYFTEKTTFKGRVFMTHPTRAIFRWLLADYVKVSQVSNLDDESEDALYTEQDLIKSYSKIEVIDYHQEVEVEGIRFTGYNAGHVLGAAMFLIEIAGVRVLYTGDYSREEDRHLMAAEKPPNVSLDVLIAESTYGVQTHQPRLEREARFTKMVYDIVRRGGRCLIPVFALGRAQELLLILDEYWQSHPELHNIPIYYASSLAKKCMAVYQTYTNMMNERIRKQVKISNPFQFKHISNLRSKHDYDDIGPCVMMASPGMLQSGFSRELLEQWCINKANGVIIPGYVVEGTLGNQILTHPDEIVSMSGMKLPLRLTIDYISFSAHVDYLQNSEFIEEVGAPHLILVHGDAMQMGRLKSRLQSEYMEKDKEIVIHTPKNCESVELTFKGEKMAKTLGKLASDEPAAGHVLSGVLVQRDFQYHLMDPSELDEYTGLNTSVVLQKQSIKSRAPFGLVRWHLEQTYGKVESGADSSAFTVFNTVKVRDVGGSIYVLEWEGGAINDMIADSVLSVVVMAESSPASVKATKSKHHHHHGHSHSHDHSHNHGQDQHHSHDEQAANKKDAANVDAGSSGAGVVKLEPKADWDVEIKTENNDDQGATLGSDQDMSDQESDGDGGHDSSGLVSVQSLMQRELLKFGTMLLCLQFGDGTVEVLDTNGKTVGPDELDDLLDDANWEMRFAGGFGWQVRVDHETATVTAAPDGQTTIQSKSDELGRRVDSVVERIRAGLMPIDDSWAPRHEAQQPIA